MKRDISKNFLFGDIKGYNLTYWPSSINTLNLDYNQLSGNIPLLTTRKKKIIFVFVIIFIFYILKFCHFFCYFFCYFFFIFYLKKRFFVCQW